MTNNLAKVLPIAPSVPDNNPAVTFNEDGSPRSYLYDMEWDFIAERKAKKGGRKKITFNTSLVDLTHIPEIQRTFYRFYQKNKDLAVSTLYGELSSLIQVASCLGSTNWALLDQDEGWGAFKDQLQMRSLAARTIQGILHMVVVASGRYIHDRKWLAKKLCCETKEQQQAIALPEAMGGKLFRTAVDMVELYHPYRYAISEAYQEYNTLYDEDFGSGKEKSNFKRWYLNNYSHNVSVKGFKPCGKSMVVNEIQVASLIVLLGFSGVRIAEALSFNKKSYDTNKYADITVPLLLGETTKGQDGGTPKRESWVTHPIAEKALELAYEMSEFARDFYHAKYAEHKDKETYYSELESAFLVLDIRHQTNKVIVSSLDRSIAKFAKKHGIVATVKDVEEFNLLNPTRHGDMKLGANLPKLSPHDFRRTFAVFLMRNKLASILALKCQYKHTNEVMTRWYSNHSELAVAMDLELDTELQEIVQEVNREITAISLFEIHNSETLSGMEGEKLVQKRNDDGFYAGEIYTSLEECRQIVKNNNISIVEHPTGYCIDPSCKRICANDKSGQTCQNEIVTLEKAKDRLPAYNRLVKRFKWLNNGQYYLHSVLKNLQLEIKSMEMTFNKHNIEFTPMGDLEINSNSIVVENI